MGVKELKGTRKWVSAITSQRRHGRNSVIRKKGGEKEGGEKDKSCGNGRNSVESDPSCHQHDREVDEVKGKEVK